MANAIILYGGRPVQATNLTQVSFEYQSGFATSFVLNGQKYTHCYPSDFRSDDQGSKPSGGYYQEFFFLQYLVKQISLQDILNAYALKFKDLTDAQDGDTLISHTLYLSSPYTDFCKFSNYSWTYNIKVNPTDPNGNIIFPGGTPPTVPVSLNVNALAFYNFNISLINSSDFTDNKDQGAFYLASCALTINMINRDIFPTFNQDADLVAYVTSQNAEWSGGAIFNLPSLDDLKQYDLNLTNYYVAAYSNQLLIDSALPETRIFWLANVLSVNGLSIFPVSDKINILIQAINIQMISSTLNDEDFLLKVVTSVSLAPTQINSFLDQLISPSTTFQNTLYGEITLFEAIYLNVADNRTAVYTLGLYSLPPDRKLYIQALYNLWLNSKYNPYFDDPSYTQPADPLGFFPESYFMTQSGQQNYNNDTASPTLVYSTSQGGVSDYTSSFAFQLNGYSIKIVNVKDKVNSSIPDLSLVGNYLIYQPVVVIGYKSDLDIALPQICYIPLFYLYYADEYKSTKDFDFGVLTLENVFLTYNLFDASQSLSWIKGLSTLRDLTDPQKFVLIWQAVAGVNAALEFTAGSVLALANYIVNTSTDPDIANLQGKINIFLCVFAIATVSLNILTKQRLIVAANNVISEQQALLALGKPVNLPDEVIQSVAAIANNTPILVNLMQTKVDGLALSVVSTKFAAFTDAQKFDFFKSFYNLNDVNEWSQLDLLIPTNPDPSVSYNLIDIWANDITPSQVLRNNIPFLKAYGYAIYQEPSVWNHFDAIQLSPAFGGTDFNPIGGHTEKNFIEINDIADLDNLSNTDLKFIMFDPTTPDLPPSMQKYSYKSSPTAGDHIQHQNLYVWNPNATTGDYQIGNKVFRRIPFKTQINPDWSESRLKEEIAYGISTMNPKGPVKSSGKPLFGQSDNRYSQAYSSFFTDGSQLNITRTTYEWQANQLFKNYVSSILIVK